jgi:hypothetical protein
MPMTTDEVRLRKYQRAIAALLVSGTVRKAAQVIGVSERSLWRWHKQPEFQELYRQAASGAFQAATRKMRTLGAEMVDTLLEIAKDGDSPAAARVSAALGTLKLGLDAETVESIESRIEKLERQTEDGPTP